MPYNYYCDVMSIMADWSDSESIKLYICTLHLIVIACVSLLPVPFTTIRYIMP